MTPAVAPAAAITAVTASPATLEGVIALALAVMTLVAVGLALAIAGRRALRRRGAQRRRRAAAPLRGVLMELAAGEPGEVSAAVDRLAGADARTWAAVEPAVVGLLGKVRGDSRDGVVTVLAARGVLARAGRDLHRRGALRRVRAADLLGRARDVTAVHALIGLLTDPDDEVRAVAARALGRIGSPRAVGPLLAGLGRHHRALPVTVVAQALLHVGAPGAPAVAVSLMSAAALERTTAAEVLGRLGAVSAFDRLVDTARHDDVPEVAAAAVTALGRLGTPGALDVLVAASAADRPTVLRAAAARALGALGVPSSAGLLADLADDPDPVVAQDGAAALAAVLPRDVRERVVAGASS